MYDPHRDVAKMAADAFESVFAEDKRDKTLQFCHDDIFALLRGNLLEVRVTRRASPAP